MKSEGSQSPKELADALYSITSAGPHGDKDSTILTPTVPLPSPRSSWAQYRRDYPDLTEEECASAFVEVNREKDIPAVARYSLNEARQFAVLYEVGEDDAWRAVWGLRLNGSAPFSVAYRQGWVAAVSELKQRIQDEAFERGWTDLTYVQEMTNKLLSETYLQPAEVVQLGEEFRSPFNEAVMAHNRKAPKLNKEPGKGHLRLLTFDEAGILKNNIVVQDERGREFNYLPIKPSAANPYAMQPWNHLAFSPGTRGYKGAASQGAALKRATWMAKFNRWFALTENQAETFAKKYGGPGPEELVRDYGMRLLLEKSGRNNPFIKKEELYG